MPVIARVVLFKDWAGSMNLYDEFFSTVAMFNKVGIGYGVLCGIAVAFHGRPRFTGDIDLLIHEKDMDVLKGALERLDHEEAAEPWLLPGTTIILRRFLKVEGQDEMMISVLLTTDHEHLRIIENAVSEESEAGPAPIAAKRDIIWMKRSKNSEQDRVDIWGLEENDEDRESS